MIDKLTRETHLCKGENVPGGSFNNTQTWSYAGPGTTRFQRMREGYTGVSELDEADKVHNLFYYFHKDVKHRTKADIILTNACRNILDK